MEPADIIGIFRLTLASVCALGAVTVAATPALAHHSFAMFDEQKKIKLDGTVTQLQLINPHSWLTIMAPDPAGKPTVWQIEMGGPHQVEEMGLTTDPAKPGEKIKPGDKISVTIHPLRNGGTGGSFISALLADGHELAQGARPSVISQALQAGQN